MDTKLNVSPEGWAAFDQALKFGDLMLDPDPKVWASATTIAIHYGVDRDFANRALKRAVKAGRVLMRPGRDPVTGKIMALYSGSL